MVQAENSVTSHKN